MIGLLLAALVGTAHAQAPEARQDALAGVRTYNVTRLMGDGTDLTIDSVEPRSIRLPPGQSHWVLR